MSVNTLEKTLWLIGNHPDQAARFIADPDGYLATSRLDDAECRLVRELDVAALARRGVNAFLLMYLYQAVKGPDAMGEYMQRMNAPLAA